MPAKRTSASSPPVYRTKPLRPHRDDSYKARAKYPEPTVCPQCHAVFHAGHWQWLPAPPSAHSELCPACHRIRDEAPAGYVRLEGPFVSAHASELAAVARNVESKEKDARPINRIMAISTDREGIEITTTDSHLARDIGEAVRHAFQGTLTIRYGPDDNLARVKWTR